MSLLRMLQGEKGLQAVQGTKPAIITASRPITKMIVTQPKGMSSGSQATATKIIPTKIVYGQQGKTQVRRVVVFFHHICLIKCKYHHYKLVDRSPLRLSHDKHQVDNHVTF